MAHVLDDAPFLTWRPDSASTYALLGSCWDVDIHHTELVLNSPVYELSNFINLIARNTLGASS